jgi:hypothetical protein
MPSSTVKTAPHLGHLTFVSFEIPVHPKAKPANIPNAKKMLTHFLITLHLLSWYSQRSKARLSHKKDGYQKSFSMSSKKFFPRDFPPPISFS